MNAQPSGSYPRLNAAMVNSGKYHQMIVSVVGKMMPGGAGADVNFQCSDGGLILLGTEHGEIPSQLEPNAVVEVVGQVANPHKVDVSD